MGSITASQRVFRQGKLAKSILNCTEDLIKAIKPTQRRGHSFKKQHPLFTFQKPALLEMASSRDPFILRIQTGGGSPVKLPTTAEANRELAIKRIASQAQENSPSPLGRRKKTLESAAGK
jgi:hypothetical protein